MYVAIDLVYWNLRYKVTLTQQIKACYTLALHHHRTAEIPVSVLYSIVAFNKGLTKSHELEDYSTVQCTL
jgi:hypothetical protein